MMYFMQVTFYSTLFYGIYFILLRNRMQHKWSRIYLLLCAILPLILPFIKIAAQGLLLPVREAWQVMLPVITITGKASKLTNVTALVSSTVFIVYWLVLLVLLVRMIISYVSMMRIIKKCKTEDRDGVKLVYNMNIGPGSWRRYIFLPEDSIDVMIFDHETAHVKLRHSLDTDIMHLLGCFCWPNFMLVIISKELRIVHEFQADAYACRNKENYYRLLLNQVFNTNSFLLLHTFVQHPLNRRIMMLKKSGSRSPKAAGVVTFIFALCLCSSIIFAQSVSKQTSSINSTSQQASRNLRDVRERVEKMPEFPGSINDFLAKKIKYPKEAKERQVQGRVIVKFIVNSNGDVVEPQIVKSPSNLLSSAALDVIKNMPKWVPGEDGGKKVSVYYYLPILFKL